MLADMGIDVWRLRTGAATAAESASTPAPAPSAAAAAAALLETAHPPQRRRSVPRASPPSSAPSAGPGPAVGPEAAPLSAVSLAVPGVVMLLDGPVSRRDRRLAMDVLASAASDWQAKPLTRQFDWPPRIGAGAVATGADALQRALEAFVDKDLADHGASLLLCSETLAAQLPDRWPDCRRVLVPTLERLGRDASLKRALWQSLRRPQQQGA
jgi:hypothetical protein